jgi:hypothetical protein
MASSFFVVIFLSFFVVALAARAAAVAVSATPVDIFPALGTQSPVAALKFHHFLFFLKPPKRTFFFG